MFQCWLKLSHHNDLIDNESFLAIGYQLHPVTFFREDHIIQSRLHHFVTVRDTLTYAVNIQHANRLPTDDHIKLRFNYIEDLENKKF